MKSEDKGGCKRVKRYTKLAGKKADKKQRKRIAARTRSAPCRWPRCFFSPNVFKQVAKTWPVEDDATEFRPTATRSLKYRHGVLPLVPLRPRVDPTKMCKKKTRTRKKMNKKPVTDCRHGGSDELLWKCWGKWRKKTGRRSNNAETLRWRGLAESVFGLILNRIVVNCC